MYMKKRQNRKKKQITEETKQEELIKKLFPLFIIGITFLGWVVCCLISKQIQESQNKNKWHSEVSSFKEQSKNDVSQSVFLELLDSTTVATVYNAVPAQCKEDCSHPANYRFTIDLNNPGAHRIVAFERTFASALGLEFGDIVYIEGTKYDGYYQYHDRMNKRFKGQHKIDLLVDNSIRYGKWNNVKLYKVNGTEEQLESIRSENFLASL